MITIHHLDNSHSHVAIWLLEELALPYRIVHHARDPITSRAPETLRAIHPAGKAPTIEDHGMAMVESTGIILYIMDVYGAGRLRPSRNTPEAMQFFQWLTFLEGSAKGPLIQLARPASRPDDPARVATEQAVTTHLGLIETALDQGQTIVPGSFTAADIQLGFFENVLEGLGRISAWPNMMAHLERMRGREAYQRAEARGGPVSLKALLDPAARE